MSPPRVSSDMADDSWVQRVVDAACVTVSQQNLSTVSACPRRKQTQSQSSHAAFESSQAEFAQSAVWMQRRWRSTKNLASLNTRMHFFESGARDSSDTYSHLATILDLRGVQPQPPILNQSSVVLRRPAHEAMTTRVRNMGKSKEEPTQFWRHQNISIRRTLSTKQVPSWSTSCADRHSARRPLGSMRPRRWCS